MILYALKLSIGVQLLWIGYGKCLIGTCLVLCILRIGLMNYDNFTGKGRPIMTWPTRMKIALGSAKGLAYLHEDCEYSMTSITTSVRKH